MISIKITAAKVCKNALTTKYFSLFFRAATEFGAGDGGGDGHIEAVGCGALMEVRDEQAVAYSLAHGVGNAVALVAHDDEGRGGEWLGVDVVAVEEGAIDGEVAWQRIEQGGEVIIIYVYARDAAHRGLYHLGVPGVGSVGAADEGGDAEPVGDADDGAEVAGVLYAVEGEGEAFDGGRSDGLGHGKQGEHLLGVLLEGEALQLVGGDGLRHDALGGLPVGGGKDGLGLEALKEVAYHLGALGYEEAFATTVFLLFEQSDKFQLVFTDHFQKSR